MKLRTIRKTLTAFLRLPRRKKQMAIEAIRKHYGI
jgi:hypothetical protein